MSPDHPTRPHLTGQALGDHVRRLADTSPADMDALLTELLIHVYPTSAIQDA